MPLDNLFEADYIKFTLLKHKDGQADESESDLSEKQFKDFSKMLALSLRNLIYTQGSIINYNFFNKSLKLRLTEWRQLTDKDNLEKHLQNLSLKPNIQYLKVTLNTLIEIENNLENKLPLEQEDLETAEEITFKSIGGLDLQVQLIVEAMEYALGIRISPNGILFYFRFDFFFNKIELL